MKGGRLPRCGGARRRGSPEIKRIPATGINSRASSDPERDNPGRINSAENSDAPARLGKDQPGDGRVVTAGRAAKRLKTADCIMQALAIAIARLGAAAVVLEFLRFVSGLFRRPTGPVPAPIDQAG